MSLEITYYSSTILIFEYDRQMISENKLNIIKKQIIKQFNCVKYEVIPMKNKITFF